MNLRRLLTDLRVTSASEVLAEHWEESEACFPPNLPRFLEPASISRQRTFAGFPADLDETLLAAASRVAGSPALLHLAWHGCRMVYEQLDYSPEKLKQWPELTSTLGPLAGAFYLLLALEAVPRTRAVHRRIGVPEDITCECFGQITESMEYYAMQCEGMVGARPGTLYWLRNHVKGDLFRLGRFDYMLKPFAGRLKAWRHRESGQVQALALEGARFDGTGLMAKGDAPESWQGDLIEGVAGVKGSPISPLGYARREEVSLPTSEWDLVLAPGDTILETHIPAGGGMTPTRCRESMQRALDFFPRHFPESPFAGFACNSWILNPQMDRIYSPGSNMVQWQRELYLFPVPSGDRAGVYFIFGEDDPNPRSAPRDTSLRRALLDHLASGGRLISGGMFLLTEDFRHFGSQVYRRQAEATEAEASAATQ